MNETFKCNVCNKVLASLRTLRAHVKNIHGDEVGAKCHKCLKMLASSTRLKTHLKICQKNIQLKCELCNEAFRTSKGLKTHMLDHSEKFNFQCHLCTDEYKTEESLKRHLMVTHAPKGNFTCPHCSKPFKIELLFSQHVRKCQRSKKEKKSYQCNLCLKSFCSEKAVRNHKSSFHEGLRNFACTKCEKTYTDNTPLRKHMQTVHTVKGSFECKECKKMFENAVKLDAHNYRSHVTKDDKIKCRFCNKALHKYSIKYHEQAHIDYDAEKFKCEKCSRLFSRNFEFKRHMKKHENIDNNIVENHKCDQCDKSYKLKEYLNKHIRYIHKKSEAGKWICNICQKEFSQYGPLSIHKKRIHADLEPQDCQECGKTYPSKLHLKDHMTVTHNARRDNECQVCKKKFTKHGLKEHMKYHEGNIFDCNLCDSKYKTKESLKFHVSRKHIM